MQKSLAAMLSKVWPSFSLAGIDVKMVKKMFKLSDAKRVRHWVFERLQVTLSGRRKRRRTLSIIMEELRLGRGIVRSKFSTGWSLVLNVKSWNMKRTTCSSVLWHGVLRASQNMNNMFNILFQFTRPILSVDPPLPNPSWSQWSGNKHTFWSEFWVQQELWKYISINYFNVIKIDLSSDLFSLWQWSFA